MGLELAKKRSKKLCCVDKANVLESSRLWKTVQSMEKDYPDISVSYEFVDAVAMRLVQWPKNYDVLVTENLFGDILTDKACNNRLDGSYAIWFIGNENSLYELHSRIIPSGSRENIANPLATILSCDDV